MQKKKIGEKKSKKSFRIFFQKVKKAKNKNLKVKNHTNYNYSTVFQFQETVLIRNPY